jgi:flavin-dependent dehydrogenase
VNTIVDDPHDYDVVIVGGGLAGLTLALQLKKKCKSLTIGVIERNKMPLPTASHKVGESTVEMGAHYLAEVVGLKDYLLQEQLPKFGLRFFFGSGCNFPDERREVGVSRYFPTPSYQLDRGTLENHLAKKAIEIGIEFFADCQLKDFSTANNVHIVTIAQGAVKKNLQSRWFVDASGRSAFIKRRLNLKKNVKHSGDAVWWRVRSEMDVSEWGKREEWKNGFTGLFSRRLSTNHFMGENYWVWVIPLANGYTSVGIVGDPICVSIKNLISIDQAAAWLEEKEPKIAAYLTQGEILDYRVVKQYSHGCTRVFSSDGWFLTGEAGVFLDPFYSPGSDFIGISNTFITEIISEQYEQKNGSVTNKQAFRPSYSLEFYNAWYLELFTSFLEIYTDRYKIWGNPLVMPVKIVWDYIVYWSFLAFSFHQGKIADKEIQVLCLGETEKIRKINSEMQNLFSVWHEKEPNHQNNAGFIDMSECEYLYKLNGSLNTQLSRADYCKEFSNRCAALHSVAAEIVAMVYRRHPELKLDSPAIFSSQYFSPNGLIAELLESIENDY